MEGKGVLAWWDHRAHQLVVHSATQVPHLIRMGLAEVLHIPQADIRVIAPDVGGGFGYKCLLQPEEVAVAWLALTRKTPFRWLEDRREHLVAGANARQHQYRLTAYADTRGRLLGLDAEVSVDTGAYSVWPFTACLEAAQAGGNLPGPYRSAGYRCRYLFSCHQQAAVRAVSWRGAAGRVLRDRIDDRRDRSGCGARSLGGARGESGARHRRCRTSTSPASDTTAATIRRR